MPPSQLPLYFSWLDAVSYVKVEHCLCLFALFALFACASLARGGVRSSWKRLFSCALNGCISVGRGCGRFCRVPLLCLTFTAAVCLHVVGDERISRQEVMIVALLLLCLLACPHGLSFSAPVVVVSVLAALFFVCHLSSPLLLLLLFASSASSFS